MVWPDIRTLAIVLLAPVMLALTPQQEGSVKTVQVDVDLVMVNVSVTDPHGRPVTGLEQGQFRIWEDKIEQKIEHFSSEEVPASIGIIFDASGSMSDKLPEAKAAAVTFLNEGNLQDEHFLIEFSNRPMTPFGFTKSVSSLEKRLASTAAHGSTSLYDAVYVGLKKVITGIHSKRGLLLITDGGDTTSRYTFSDLAEFAKEQDVQVYLIDILGGLDSVGYSLGVRPRIAELSELTGGRAYFAKSVRELKGISSKIAADLKSQYIIGFLSTNRVRDGRWRTLQVRVNPAEGLPRLSVRARTGYYAPGNGGTSK